MFSSAMLSEAMEEVKKITSLDALVADEEGNVKAATIKPVQDILQLLSTFILSDKTSHEDPSAYFLREDCEGTDITFTVVLMGQAKDRATLARLTALQVKNILKGNESHTPVNDLLSNLLLDNILHTNIESEASYLGLDPTLKRRVIIAEAGEGTESSLFTGARNAFTGRKDIYVVSVERGKIALIVEGGAAEKHLDEANAIYSRLGGNNSGVLRIACGLPVDNLEELIRSYRQAVTALEVAALFNPDETIVSYDELGIGRIINTLPEDICEAFISENFKPGEMDGLDKEILYTVEEFFDNSLNISETARKMFIHRNTLIYRLNKLYNHIGLDVRNFEDAMTFKLASMVNKRYKALRAGRQ